MWKDLPFGIVTRVGERSFTWEKDLLHGRKIFHMEMKDLPHGSKVFYMEE